MPLSGTLTLYNKTIKLLKEVIMKTVEGNNIQCSYTGKICYTQREAGMVINDCKKHRFYGKHSVKVGFGNSKSIPRRKYYCKDCGYYHITHLPLYGRDSQNYAWEDVFYREMAQRKRKVAR